jgi:hypothetical protein
MTHNTFGYFGFSGINAAPRDVTPDAVDWANISGNDPAENVDQTISGITTPITLRATMGTCSGTSTGGNFVALVNGGAAGNVNATTGATLDFTVNPGDTVRFRLTVNGLTSGQTWNCGTVTISNQSAGSALDTFTASAVNP